MSEPSFPVLFTKTVEIRRHLPNSTVKTEPLASRVTICRAVDLKPYRGEPVDGYRIQLDRPGGPFLFLADEEFRVLAEGMISLAEVTVNV